MFFSFSRHMSYFFVLLWCSEGLACSLLIHDDGAPNELTTTTHGQQVLPGQLSPACCYCNAFIICIAMSDAAVIASRLHRIVHQPATTCKNGQV